MDEQDLEMDMNVLKDFWFSKAKTSEKPLALVAIGILEIVISSVSSERLFSIRRLVINEQRIKISPEHACHQ